MVNNAPLHRHEKQDMPNETRWQWFETKKVTVLHTSSCSTELRLAFQTTCGEFLRVQERKHKTHHMQLNTKIWPLPLGVTEPYAAAGGEFLHRFPKTKKNPNP